MTKAAPSDTATDRFSTHSVLVLRAVIEPEAPWAEDRCEALGAVAGDDEVQELARLANRQRPELRTHDRLGNRIDWVDFHSSWHQLMSLAWRRDRTCPYTVRSLRRSH